MLKENKQLKCKYFGARTPSLFENTGELGGGRFDSGVSGTDVRSTKNFAQIRKT